MGGPLALLRTGDLIKLDVGARSLDMLVSEDDLDKRRAEYRVPEPKYPRGYGRLYSEHIQQADQGCDFYFLAGTAPVPDPEIH